jgi:hypothetical protein
MRSCGGREVPLLVRKGGRISRTVVRYEPALYPYSRLTAWSVPSAAISQPSDVDAVHVYGRRCSTRQMRLLVSEWMPCGRFCITPLIGDIHGHGNPRSPGQKALAKSASSADPGNPAARKLDLTHRLFSMMSYARRLQRFSAKHHHRRIQIVNHDSDNTILNFLRSPTVAPRLTPRMH